MADRAEDEKDAEAAARRKKRATAAVVDSAKRQKGVNVVRATQRGELPEDFRLLVRKREYGTFARFFDYNDVSWTDFMQAMGSVGFQVLQTGENTVKFIPTGELAQHQPKPMNFHPPHGWKLWTKNEVRVAAKELEKHFGLMLKHFEVDETRRCAD